MLRITLLFALLLSVAACGGSASQGSGGPTADAAAGEKLFAQTLIGSQPGCVTCHSLEPGVTMVGPSLAKVGAEAGSRVSGQSAEEYLRNSIVKPNDYVVEGFAANIMPAQYSTELSEQQINDLVAYMQTLK
jgi:cytochrome c551/c552